MTNIQERKEQVRAAREACRAAIEACRAVVFTEDDWRQGGTWVARDFNENRDKAVRAIGWADEQFKNAERRWAFEDKHWPEK